MLRSSLFLALYFIGVAASLPTGRELLGSSRRRAPTPKCTVSSQKVHNIKVLGAPKIVSGSTQNGQMSVECSLCSKTKGQTLTCGNSFQVTKTVTASFTSSSTTTVGVSTTIEVNALVVKTGVTMSFSESFQFGKTTSTSVATALTSSCSTELRTGKVRLDSKYLYAQYIADVSATVTDNCGGSDQITGQMHLSNVPTTETTGECKTTKMKCNGSQSNSMMFKNHDLESSEPPAVAVANATSAAAQGACMNGPDQDVWVKQQGNFSMDMAQCGKQCWGASSCVASCMQKLDGYSTGCAACFGKLAGCTASKCMLQCIKGDSPACAACVRENQCDTKFSTCSGVTPPSDADAARIVTMAVAH